MESKRAARLDTQITDAGKQAIMDQAAREERSFPDMVRLLLKRGLEASPK